MSWCKPVSGPLATKQRAAIQAAQPQAQQRLDQAQGPSARCGRLSRKPAGTGSPPPTGSGARLGARAHQRHNASGAPKALHTIGHAYHCVDVAARACAAMGSSLRQISKRSRLTPGTATVGPA